MGRGDLFTAITPQRCQCLADPDDASARVGDDDQLVQSLQSLEYLLGRDAVDATERGSGGLLHSLVGLRQGFAR